MKNRKTVVVAFMLVACLVIGVGYAAVTNVLDIQGSISVSATAAEKQFNEDIYFEGVVDNTNAAVASITDSATYGYTANINTNNNDKAQFTVTGIEKTDDFVTITYRIKNDSEHEATVSLKTITNTNGSAQGNGTGDFGFSYYFGTEGVETDTIAVGGTVDVTVKVSLDSQLTAAATASFVIELNVTAGA